jgi:hypothetical protein
VSSPHKSVLPSDSSGIPKSTSHTRLKEHRDDPEGIEVHPEDGSHQVLCMFPTFGRLFQSQDHCHRVGTTLRYHAHKSRVPWLVLQLEVK